MSCLITFFVMLFALCPSMVRCQKDSGAFDAVMIDAFEAQWHDLEPGVMQELLSKTGKIAFYLRLYRAWMFMPNGQKGFMNRFPDPPVQMPEALTLGCSRYLKECIRFIYHHIQNRASFLFPLRHQIMPDFILDEDRFRNLIADSMFAHDVSMTYIMCFFVKNRISLMRRLPFCGYNVLHGKADQMWPSSAFRDAVNNPVIDDATEFIDDLSAQEDFACAEESFCPDPCCRHSRNRTCFHPLCTPQDFRREVQHAVMFDTSTIQYPCRMEPLFNDNFWALTRNQWNVSCNCPLKGHVFRFDTLQCVDVDECDMFEESPCNPFESCLNLVGGFLCICIPGYFRPSEDADCIEIPIEGSSLPWNGIAFAPLQTPSQSPMIANPFSKYAYLIAIHMLKTQLCL